MKRDSYHAGKVLSQARSVLVALGEINLKHQTKIKIALKGMPLCESYLDSLGVPNPRPNWIAELGIDVGRWARDEVDYPEHEVINTMAPQHKAMRLQELLHWWISAVYIAGEVRGELNGVLGRIA